MICNYGCGEKAKYQLKNGKWCCSKFACQCISIREMNRNKNLGRKQSKETIRKRIEKFKGYKHSKEIKNFLSKKMVENRENPSSKYNTEEYKNILSNKIKGKKRSVETKNKIRISKLGQKNPNFGKIFSFEYRKKLRDSQIKRFKNPELVKKWSSCCNVKPNKPEKFLISLLEPYGYKYTGDFTFWVDGKNPDFINTEKHKVIEFFGRYYHKPEDELYRIEHFQKNEYSCLIIWEEELLDVNKLKERIINFTSGVIK